MSERLMGGLARWAVGHHQATQGPISWGIYDPVYAYFPGTIMAPSLLPQGKKHSGLDAEWHGQLSAGHREGFRFCSLRDGRVRGRGACA